MISGLKRIKKAYYAGQPLKNIIVNGTKLFSDVIGMDLNGTMTPATIQATVPLPGITWNQANTIGSGVWSPNTTPSAQGDVRTANLTITAADGYEFNDPQVNPRVNGNAVIAVVSADKKQLTTSKDFTAASPPGVNNRVYIWGTHSRMYWAPKIASNAAWTQSYTVPNNVFRAYPTTATRMDGMLIQTNTKEWYRIDNVLDDNSGSTRIALPGAPDLSSIAAHTNGRWIILDFYNNNVYYNDSIDGSGPWAVANLSLPSNHFFLGFSVWVYGPFFFTLGTYQSNLCLMSSTDGKTWSKFASLGISSSYVMLGISTSGRHVIIVTQGSNKLLVKRSNDYGITFGAESTFDNVQGIAAWAGALYHSGSQWTGTNSLLSSGSLVQFLISDDPSSTALATKSTFFRAATSVQLTTDKDNTYWWYRDYLSAPATLKYSANGTTWNQFQQAIPSVFNPNGIQGLVAI